VEFTLGLWWASDFYIGYCGYGVEFLSEGSIDVDVIDVPVVLCGIYIVCQLFACYFITSPFYPQAFPLLFFSYSGP
jgi:hypothetical protein